MKKTFIQLRQWISKYKKRLIYGALAFFIGQICLFDIWWIGIDSEVYADGTEKTAENTEFQAKVESWQDSLAFVENIIYMFTYPILVVAGKFVDNSMVYGEIFGFDAVLWKLWVIVRNMANYGLWFIFLFKVFQFLIWKKVKDFKKDILLPALVAWVWIQASWFIMGALIDISTIATYGIWGLPITILWANDNTVDQSKIENNPNFYNPYVWKTALSYDVKKWDTLKVYLNTWDIYISECEIFTFLSGVKENLILAPKYIYYPTGPNDWKPTLQTWCHYDNRVYYFHELYVSNSWNETGQEAQNNYEKKIKDARNGLNSAGFDVVAGQIRNWAILQIWDAHASWWIAGAVFKGISYNSNQERWQDVNNKRSWKNFGLKKMSEQLDNKSEYQTVFSSLYATLLEAWKDMNLSNENNSIYVKFLNALLSVWHMMAICIPLIAMSIVFVMRIWVLWLAISLSPIIILLKAFDLEKNIPKAVDFLKIENLIPIIFSPVIICFAVSLSTVLVRIIATMNWEKINTEPIILWWTIKMDIAWVATDISKLIVSVIWIAITWFLVWAAVKSTSIWKNLESLQNLAESAIASAPIIPVPGKDGNVDYLGAGTVFGRKGSPEGIISKMNNNLINKFTERDTKAVDALMGNGNNDEDMAKKRLTAYTRELTWLSWNSITNWIEKELSIWEGETKEKLIFKNLSDGEKEEVIKSINALDENKRKGFGDAVSEIKIWSKTWKFDTEKAEYKASNESEASA